MIQQLYVATANPGKLSEFKALLGDLPVEIHGLPARVEETGETFEENARLKAEALSGERRDWVVADDSGLEVEVLNDAPGVFSARFAGPESSDEANKLKLMESLRGEKNRKARFVCVLALARDGETILTLRGECSGVIAESPRGKGGFGYDPLFLPEGSDRTFAELDPEEKNHLSHRGRALRQFRQRLPEVLGF